MCFSISHSLCLSLTLSLCLSLSVSLSLSLSFSLSLTLSIYHSLSLLFFPLSLSRIHLHTQSHLLIWQRVNHFEGSKELSRKDLLKKNIERYTDMSGKAAEVRMFKEKFKFNFCVGCT